jgi:hypothetical protein
MATLGVHYIPQTLKFAVIHLDITIPGQAGTKKMTIDE